MNATKRDNIPSENMPSQWMMKQLKELSGSMSMLQQRMDKELKELSGSISTLQQRMDVELKELSGSISTLQQRMDVELKALSGSIATLQARFDTELKHLPTQDDIRKLERDMATIRERTDHLSTKADVNFLKGIASVIAIAAVSMAIKMFFFG